MKRSINKFAALAILAFVFASCSEDPDSTPNFAPVSPSESSFLQGDWELVNSDDGLKGQHTLQIEDNITMYKLGNGDVIRAAYFKLVNDEEGDKIVFGKNIFVSPDKVSIPEFFNDSRIISLNQDELVLKAIGTYTFKKIDPVN